MYYAIVFLKNALSLLKSVSIEDVHAKYKSLILYHLSAALRRKGAYQDAKGAAEEALRLAVDNGNRPVQARCLHSLGDIHREFKEEERTWSRYESAYKLMQEISDKMGQIFVLSSMAKAAVTLRSAKSSTCECQAIQLNKKCLEVAKSVGCKLLMLKSHARLQYLYRHLNDEESEDIARKAVTTLTQEMELFCNFCGQRYGIKDESLQALPCSHIYHERCLREYLSVRDKKQCPKCQHKTSSLKILKFTTPPPMANAVGLRASNPNLPSTSNQIQSHHFTPPPPSGKYLSYKIFVNIFMRLGISTRNFYT